MSNTFKIAIVVSRFNEPVTQKLLQGARDRLTAHNIAEDRVKICWVPGAVEIPFIANRLAKTKEYAAVICLGAVIYGETSHFDYVCQMVSQGCLRVSLDHDLPVIFGVLTTQTAEQAFARAGGQKGNKGADAVDTALEMVDMIS